MSKLTWITQNNGLLGQNHDLASQCFNLISQNVDLVSQNTVVSWSLNTPGQITCFVVVVVIASGYGVYCSWYQWETYTKQDNQKKNNLEKSY